MEPKAKVVTAKWVRLSGDHYVEPGIVIDGKFAPLTYMAVAKTAADRINKGGTIPDYAYATSFTILEPDHEREAE